MLGLQNDQMTALWENVSLAFTFYRILAYLHTCILAYSWFCAASKSNLKWLRFSFNEKMSKQGATEQYWSILTNDSEYVIVLGYIWQYRTISECSLHCHNWSEWAERVTWAILNKTGQYWTIFKNIGQYWTILGNIRQYLIILCDIEQYCQISFNI